MDGQGIGEIERNHPFDGSASSFGTWIRAYVGPFGERRAETFDIQVCTPNWLKSQCTAQGPLWGRHMLIVDIYNYNVIKTHIER
ncbi:Imm8 family immunity protein [Cupriavidus sp. H18C1]|uniref:Imm8 family immunity protein n=1 Tax=Cupriavidus sp. H18C1 TaxID=3241601 RepID=UPI003BB8CB0D